ncbi:hypothetical protein GE09DRAFT_1231876 [Coniochaeta sp. 2T2.1]|nr:hypothetical protein GE09DRAFT_1231876 [Coniochaeta sp. 2T2.1]
MSVLKDFLAGIPYWVEQLNQLPTKIQQQQYELSHLKKSHQGAPLPSDSVTNGEFAERLETKEQVGAATQHPFSKDDPSHQNVSPQQSTTSGAPITHNTQASAQWRKRSGSGIIGWPQKRTCAATDIYYDKEPQLLLLKLHKFLSGFSNHLRQVVHTARKTQMMRQSGLDWHEHPEHGNWWHSNKAQDSDALEVDEGPQTVATNNEALTPLYTPVRIQSTRRLEEDQDFTVMKAHLTSVGNLLEKVAFAVLSKGHCQGIGEMKEKLREIETVAEKIREKTELNGRS